MNRALTGRAPARQDHGSGGSPRRRTTGLSPAGTPTSERAAEEGTMQATERFAYFNGQYVPERLVLVPFRDRGFKYGDAVFDTTRTFGHRVFKLAEHVERLYRSLRYLRIDPGLTPAEMIEITGEVVSRNLPLLDPDEDYWVTQRVSRGLDASAREIWPDRQGATVIVEC